MISLDKRAEQIGVILTKKGINKAPVLRVLAALDISGSMDMAPARIISTGKLQGAFDQLMGVASKFDDNGELDVLTFNTRCKKIGTSKPVLGDYDTFITRNNITASGGTAYSPVVEEIVKFSKPSGFFKKQGAPVLALILTDGEPDRADVSTTLRALEKAQSEAIYFHFVGVGGTRATFPTIAMLADKLPNVGEVYLPRFDLPDEVIYDQLICDELVEWFKKTS